MSDDTAKPTLWAPQRMQYLQQLGHARPDRGSACFLCEAAAGRDDPDDAQARLVLVNDERGIVLLNRYPYTSGHLLIAPRAHVAKLGDLAAEQRAGLMELVAWFERVTTAAFHCQGLNVGINLGNCAGASQPGHLHIHVVPRWNGDVNFMETVAGVRVIPQALEEAHALYRATMAQLENGETVVHGK